ncbi:hypothetical protein SUGI_0382130 [Cryptomeria japonica]|nr:hypothetical protein SUGI_0382130 [Cryptomeria japonica]
MVDILVRFSWSSATFLAWEPIPGPRRSRSRRRSPKPKLGYQRVKKHNQRARYRPRAHSEKKVVLYKWALKELPNPLIFEDAHTLPNAGKQCFDASLRVTFSADALSEQTADLRDKALFGKYWIGLDR